MLGYTRKLGLPMLVIVLACGGTERSHCQVDERTVSDVAAQPDFAKQVIPLLTQAGCNSGACHGAAAGRGYLNLSLYGARPELDYETLLFSVPGRFIDLQKPVESLLLQKPAGYLDHGGGVRLDSDGTAFGMLRDWISSGALPGSMAEITRLSIKPGTSITARIGQPVSIAVEALWSDGHVSDVTDRASVTNAQPLGSVNATVEYWFGERSLELVANSAGYWPINIRFGKQATTVQLFINEQAQASVQVADGKLLGEAEGYTPDSIDAWVKAVNARVGFTVAGRCSSHLLARRLWLDLWGRHPSRSEWEQASRAIDSGEIESLVDQLLASDEFAAQAGQVIAGWAIEGSKLKSVNSTLAVAISDSLQQSDNLRGLVQRMLTVPRAEAVDFGGKTDPLTRFHGLASDARSRAELVASTWLGVRIGCAQCHDHPLDHWTQDDYFAMAACWAEIEWTNATTNGVRRVPGRTTTDLRNGRDATAALPDGRVLRSQSGVLTSDGQTGAAPADLALIEWLTADGNPQFSRNLANRIWAWLMGAGLVVEMDDHRVTNPAIHAGLLQFLAGQLRESDYSLRGLVRQIVLSETYARVSAADAPRLEYQLLTFRPVKMIPRSLPWLASDALGGVATAAPVLSMNQETTMMVELTSGGCARQEACLDPIAESLDIVAGEWLNTMIAAAINEQWQGTPDPLSLLDELSQSLFGRLLPENEKSNLRGTLPVASPTEREVKEWLEDVVWSWIASDEFRSLH